MPDDGQTVGFGRFQPMSNRRSLTHRLFGRIFGLYVVLATLLTSLQIGLEFSHLRDRIQGDLESLGRSFHSGVVEAAWKLDRRQLDSLVQGMVQSSILTRVAIFDPDGRSWAEATRPIPDTFPELLTTQVSPIVTETSLEFRSVRGIEPLGHMVLESSPEIALASMRQTILLVLLNSFVKAAGLWLIFYLVFRHHLVNPIRHLEHAVAMIDLDDTRAPHIPSYPFDDELGHLIDTIRRLQQRLAQVAQERTAYELTENIPVGTYTMVLPPGAQMAHFSFLSKRFLELTGLKREDALSDPFKAFACVHPEDYDHWIELNGEAFANRQPFSGETRIVVNGEVRWVAAESIPRPLPDGTYIWEGALIDVTERINTEKRLQATLAAQTRQQERESLMQDMHDGFGSQLSSARLMLERDKISSAQAAEVLRECMADLYLVVDTLGNPEGSLADALVDFRYRSTRRLAATNIEVVWKIDVEAVPLLPQKTILQLLRIGQEAFNNALKNSKASRITFSAGINGAHRVILEIADDGIGPPAEAVSGKGINSMKKRCRELGGIIEFLDNAPGFLVRFHYDIAATQEASGKPG